MFLPEGAQKLRIVSFQHASVINPLDEESQKNKRVPTTLSLYNPLLKSPILPPNQKKKMPELENITYSRDATVAAVRSYYDFLTTLYLDPAHIISPPPGGWPSITSRSHTLDKSKEVIHLLKHLPYIAHTARAEAAPHAPFADWNHIFSQVLDRRRVTSLTEDPAISDHVPRHVVGLTSGMRDCPRFLLDVQHGTVHWYACPVEIADSPLCEVVEDDPYDYCEEEGEAQWRAEGQTWAIPEFFEELKERWRRMEFVPMGRGRVEGGEGEEAVVGEVRQVFWRNGWQGEEEGA